MKITDYMSAKLITARPEDGIRTTFFRMRDEGIRHMPVVDEGGHLLGIISQRDLRRPDWVDEAPDLSHEYELDDLMEVQSLMTTNIIAVHTYDSLGHATALLRDHRIGALPVLDKHDRLVGIITTMDLLAALEDLLDGSGKLRNHHG